MSQQEHYQTVQQWQALAATPVQYQPPYSGMNMKLNDMLESKYIKQSDIDGEMLVTVQSLKKVNVAQEDETPEYKWTVTFRELAKPMVVNATNLKRMFKALGDDSDDWPGQQITLFVDPDVEFGGKIVGGLRVRSARKTAPAQRPRPTGIDDANRALNAAADDEVPF